MVTFKKVDIINKEYMIHLVPTNSGRHHLSLINNYPSYEQTELKKIKTIIT